MRILRDKHNMQPPVSELKLIDGFYCNSTIKLISTIS